MKVISYVVLLTVYSQIVLAQSIDNRAYVHRQHMASSSLFRNYEIKNVGPVVQGGRVVDIAVNEKNKKEYYVAFASGGLFKTTNNGITFYPIFDNQDALGIGDIALAPSDSKIIYVGTGEKNSSRSSYAGSGIYKSTDGGKNWQSLGLTDTQHIGRIIIHPTDPNIVWVASVGALYSNNKERGIFKTTDGGNTWEKTLYINDSTGIIDLAINPDNPDQLWASSWERTRKAWNFKGNGPGSAIFRSDDGGKSWVRMTKGFPKDKMVGRIGLAVSPSSPNIIYALLDNQTVRKEEKKEDKNKNQLQLEEFRDMTPQHLMELDDEKLNEFLKENDFPKKYNAGTLKKEIRSGKYGPLAIAEYFGDANEALVTTSVIGAELYRSDDYGSTWKKMNSYDLTGVYFSYGYYFGEVRVAPENADLVYIFGVPLLKSTDGGVTYSRIDSLGDVHVDHQAMWLDPDETGHILLGNDGGLYESYDEGANWRYINNMAVGQFYTVNVDMAKPYNIYGGLQDNGSYVGSSKSIPNRTAHWEQLLGGDGMFVSPDPRDNNIVYSGFQFGNYYRVDRKQKEHTRIMPQHDIGEPILRFNWRTPLKLSSHNADIIYIGAQKLFRSFDKGETWKAISPDLTKDKSQGNVPYSTISTISESPLKFGLIYVGTDDGNLQVSQGSDWCLINDGLPENKWVSSVFASPHNENEVFVALNGYRVDDFSTYIYSSSNFGKSWCSIQGNLSDVVVNDLIQDPVNPDLLYVASDNGVYISLDKGASWELLNNIPNVAVYDIMIHPRDNDLIVGTHGRSIYIADVKPIQEIVGNKDIDLMIFDISDVHYSDKWGEKEYPYLKGNTPELKVQYYSEDNGGLTVEIFDGSGNVVREWEEKPIKGFNSLTWDLKINEQLKNRKRINNPELKYAGKGKYKTRISRGEAASEREFEIK